MNERDRGFFLSGYAAMGAIVAAVVEHEWLIAAFCAIVALIVGYVSRGMGSAQGQPK